MAYILVIVFELASGVLGGMNYQAFPTQDACIHAESLVEVLGGPGRIGMMPPGDPVVEWKAWCLPFERGQKV